MESIVLSGTIIDIANVVDSIITIIWLRRVQTPEKLDGQRRAHIIFQHSMLVQGVVRSFPRPRVFILRQSKST